MNLYQIMFRHFSPKDSETGICAYLVANSDEDVYEWLKSNPRLISEDRWITTPYEDYEDDETEYEIYDKDYEVIGVETYKERVIKLKGDMFDEEVELCDLFYGKTLYGWKLVKEDVKPDVLQIVKDLGICIEIK